MRMARIYFLLTGSLLLSLCKGYTQDTKQAQATKQEQAAKQEKQEQEARQARELRQAADGKKISGNFNGFTFPQLIDRIEPSSGYRFYYDAAEMDSLKIRLQADQLTWKELLDELFRNTDFHYSVDSTGRVFVTKGFTIQTRLPVALFQQRRSTGGPDSTKVFFCGPGGGRHPGTKQPEGGDREPMGGDRG